MTIRARILSTTFAALACFAAAANPSSATTLIVETEMDLNGISYSNLDYNNITSTDAVSFYSQRLRLGVGGKFASGVEIMARIQSLDVVGSTSAAMPTSLVRFRTHPYPNISGVPFVEHLYFKLTEFDGYPAVVTVGRQPFDAGDGLLSDNSAGLDAFKLRVNYPEKLTADIFTAKISEGFYADSDFDVYGLDLSYALNKDNIILTYISEQDSTGTLYERGIPAPTSRIVRNFLKMGVHRRDEFGEYMATYARGSGEIQLADNAGSVGLDSYAWELSGTLRSKYTKLGEVSAGLFVSMFSGEDDTLSIGGTDSEFRPSMARRYDGLEPYGHGRLFGAAYNSAAIELPEGYSGINTIGIHFDFSPFFRWTFGVDYFLFSSSEHPLRPLSEASGFERLLGAKYSLGAEMDLNVKLDISKNISAAFGYFRYTPPKEVFWEYKDPLSKYALDFSARF
jgi:hypothetical protein